MEQEDPRFNITEEFIASIDAIVNDYTIDEEGKCIQNVTGRAQYKEFGEVNRENMADALVTLYTAGKSGAQRYKNRYILMGLGVMHKVLKWEGPKDTDELKPIELFGIPCLCTMFPWVSEDCIYIFGKPWVGTEGELILGEGIPKKENLTDIETLASVAKVKFNITENKEINE